MKIAAIGDIHIGPEILPSIKDALNSVDSHAEILVIAGDLTNHGTVKEMNLCLETLTRIKVPVIAVLGNHDYESGLERELSEMLLGAGVHLLDGTTFQVNDIGFAGTKGFCGGFHPHQLMPFGESLLKDLVEVSRHEAKKLNDALTQLKTRTRVAITHYSPIRATIEGEPESIYPFLGSSHLEQVLDCTSPNLALHGHAHHGAFEGRTTSGVRVCNVALPILRGRDQALYCAIFDL